MKIWTINTRDNMVAESDGIVPFKGRPPAFNEIILAVEKKEYDKLSKVIEYIQACTLTPLVKQELEKMLK